MLKEKYIIETAIDAFATITDYRLNYKLTEEERGNSRIDGYLWVNQHTFVMEIKSYLNHLSLSQLLRYKNFVKEEEGLIFIVESISDSTKTLLREHQMNYLDSAGNAYIKTSDFHILIEGKKTTKTSELLVNKQFTKKGLMVIFHLLKNENILNFSYREISHITQTSLDTISQTIVKLKQQGYIRQLSEKEMRLTNKEDLIEKWIDAYGNLLKPSLFLKKFRFQSPELARNWKNIPLDARSFWGGEPAADMLTDFLVPSDFTLYTQDSQNELMKKYAIFPDTNGNIVVYEAFYLPDKQILDPILVYADLILSDNARNKEVAQIVKEKYAEQFR